MSDNPFKNSSQIPGYVLESRLKFLCKWLDLRAGDIVLDIGCGNVISTRLAEILGLDIYNTEGDLNWDKWEPGTNRNYLKNGKLLKFDNLLCLEVIEHLLNPLLFLKEVGKRMEKGGILYLTTPKASFRFLQLDIHFHEMGLNRLKSLINLSGCFDIIDIRTTRSGYAPFSIFYRGFRPLLRALFQKCYCLKLIRK